jgi:uncharacterized hydrophobic protein (TIGR00271 family)
MRQLIVMVPKGRGREALEIAQSKEGVNLISLAGQGLERDWDVLLIHAPNRQLDGLMAELGHIEDLHATLEPRGIIPLKPPPGEAPDQVVDVTARSPLEVFLGGLQSIGSWKGFLGYALAAGIIVWIGLFTNTAYLLTAAMLIAPFAGPAMNLALGTARGDWILIEHSVLRYFASLAVCIAASLGLSLWIGQEIPTESMIRTSLVSSVALLLPITAGAAGALHLCQSERNSLVTAAGTGMLVAASLAPPAGVIGMALSMGDWGMVRSSAFVLLLQLVGINISGTIVFALFGLSPEGVRYKRGRAWVRRGSLAATAAGLALLIAWQFWNEPELQRATQAQHIQQLVHQILEESPDVHLVEAIVRFTRAEIPGQNTLLITAYLQRRSGTDREDAELRAALALRIREAVRQHGFNATPLVDLTVLGLE